MKSKSWILLSSGTKFWPLEPKPEDIHIEDIAHALSNICRYTGHCRRFYSVAEHSYFVSAHLHEYGPRVQLQGLLHDASEAFMADIARPLKMSLVMEGYREAEARLEDIIYEKFGVSPTDTERGLIKIADSRMLATERFALLPTCPEWDEWLQGIEPYPMRLARDKVPVDMKLKFMRQYHFLSQELK